MPYFHIKDGGRVTFWGRRCQTCGARWPISAYSGYKLPKGMGWEPARKLEISRGKTGYASWGDKIPGVSIVASHLPAWPRWVRILTAFLFVCLVVFIVFILVRGF